MLVALGALTKPAAPRSVAEMKKGLSVFCQSSASVSLLKLLHSLVVEHLFEVLPGRDRTPLGAGSGPVGRVHVTQDRTISLNFSRCVFREQDIAPWPKSASLNKTFPS